MEHARTHWRERAVDHREQTLSILRHRRHQFKVAHRKLVEAHIAVGFDASQGGDMLDLGVLSEVEVMQNGTGCHHPLFHIRHAKALQRLRLKVAKQAFHGAVEAHHPIIEFESEHPRIKSVGKFVATAALNQHLFRGEIIEQLIHIFRATLGSKKFAGGNIQKRNANVLPAKAHRRQEIVFFAIQNRARSHHSRRHQFGDAALHQFFGEFRVLQLVANCHPLPGAHQFGQIGVECVVWKTRHFDAFAHAIAAAGERDAQYLACRDGILVVGFVEVAHAIKEHRIGVLALHLVEVLHHRGKFFTLCHNIQSYKKFPPHPTLMPRKMQKKHPPPHNVETFLL